MPTETLRPYQGPCTAIRDRIREILASNKRLSKTDIEFDVFISYRTSDTSTFARELADTIGRGRHPATNSQVRVFLDENEIAIGQNIDKSLGEAFKNSAVFVVVFSRGFTQSEYTQFEQLFIGTIDPAGLNERVVPVKFGDAAIPARFSGIKFLSVKPFVPSYAWHELVRIWLTRLVQGSKRCFAADVKMKAYAAMAVAIGLILLGWLGSIWLSADPTPFAEREAAGVVKAYYGSISTLLAAGTSNDKADALVQLSKYMTEDFQKRNLPKGCAESLAKSDDGERQGELARFAVTYSGWFGRSNGANVDLIGTSSWQHLDESESRHVLHVLAVVRFSGRFNYNSFPDSKWSVRKLASALDGSDVAGRNELIGWLKQNFPAADETELDVIFTRVRVSDLFQENAFDIIPFRVGSEQLGNVPEETYRFGNEVSLVSIQLTKDAKPNANWRINEIGQWGLKRVFTDTPQPFNFSRDKGTFVDGVPYQQQDTPQLCQSTCLLMLAEYLDEQCDHSQESIRADLTQIGDPLAHSSRVTWLSAAFPNWNWKMNYSPSLSETISKITNQLESGIPVITSTRLTQSGHVIVITGIWFDTNGTAMVRAHDPWGKFDFATLRYDNRVGAGRDVEYPIDRLYIENRTWESAIGTRIDSAFIVGSEQWLPSNIEQLESGLSIIKTAKDWEFITASAASD